MLIGNKLLGSLLYDKDKNNRGFLKLSFRNKIKNFTRWTDSELLKQQPTAEEPIDPVSFDVSYKFSDSLLEIKRQIGKERKIEFYKVPLPPSDCLFFIKLKNWELLDVSDSLDMALIIDPPTKNYGDIVILFSFLGKNGLPFTLPNYQIEVMRCINIPNEKIDKMCIGIAEDTINNGTLNFQIGVPASFVGYKLA